MKFYHYFLFLTLWVASAALIGLASGCGDPEPPQEPPKPNEQSSNPPDPAITHPHQLEIFITSGIRGQLNECKCPGKRYSNLVRRASILRAKENRPALVIEAGSFSRSGFGALRQEYMMKAYADIQYDAIVLGTAEMSLGKSFLDAMFDGYESTIVSANFLDAKTKQPVYQPYRLVELAGTQVAILGVVEHKDMLPTDFHLANPIEAVGVALPKARAEADVVVVVGMFSSDLADQLATRYPQIDLVIASSEQFDAKPTQRTIGSTQVVETGTIHSAVSRVVLTFDPTPSAVQEIITTDAQTVLDRRIATIVDAYKAAEYKINPGATEPPQKLSVLTILQARNGWENIYAGVASCGSCHQKEYDTWAHSKHAHAYETLRHDNDHVDRSCVECHTVGFGEDDGFSMEPSERSFRLINVGCESCHGRGALHAVIQEGKVDPETVSGFEFVSDAKQSCIQCHTKDNSPAFEFEAYWAKIKH